MLHNYWDVNEVQYQAVMEFIATDIRDEAACIIAPTCMLRSVERHGCINSNSCNYSNKYSMYLLISHIGMIEYNRQLNTDRDKQEHVHVNGEIGSNEFRRATCV